MGNFGRSKSLVQHSVDINFQIFSFECAHSQMYVQIHANDECEWFIGFPNIDSE